MKYFTKVFATLALALMFQMASAVQVTIQLFSYVANGGTTSVNWSLSPEGQAPIASGMATFSMITFQYTTTVEVDEGCYNLNVMSTTNTLLSESNFLAVVMMDGAILPPTNDVVYGSIALNYGFCTNNLPVECTACFTPMVFEGTLTVNNCSSPVNPENTSFAWDFGDGTAGDGAMPTHQYSENGVYVVCVAMVVYENGNVVCVDNTCQEVVVEGLTGSDCPTQIQVAENPNCGWMNFEIGSFMEGQSVTWYFNGWNSDPVEGGHFIEHYYAESGPHVVCAIYTGPNCPDGVELCQEFIVPECAGGCPEVIAVSQIDCDSFLFCIDNTNGGNVTWSYGDGTGENSGTCEDHTYAENGTYIVTAQYFGPNCQEGITLLLTVEVGCGNNGCDLNVVVVQEGGCQYLVLQATGMPENAEVHWTQNGEPINVGFTTTVLLVPGANQICAWYETAECGPVDWCETWLGCGGNDCPSEMEVFTFCDNGTANIYLLGLEANQGLTWEYMGAVYSTEGPSLTVEIPNGWVNVCAWSDALAEMGCPEVCQELYISCEELPCDLNVSVMQNGGCEYVTLLAADYPENAEVHWSQNGVPMGAGGLHTFILQPGANQLCAWVETVLCSAEWCETFYGCEGGCPNEIWSGAGDNCGVMLFEIGSFVEGEAVTWYPGDETGPIEGGHFLSHTYAEPGIYTVCAFYTSPLCPNGVELCTTIIVESCDINGDCPTVISHSENDCGFFSFEIGSFQEGESVDWYFGDVVVENEGHFIQHQFDVSGEIQVCAFYTSNACPDGVWLCTSVNSVLCGECTTVNFSLDSFMGDGGPAYVMWNLSDANGVEVADGIAQYGMNDPWYDYEICLEDGCYHLSVCATTEFNINAFDILAGGDWEIVEITPVSNFLCYGYDVLLALNSDCGNGGCEASFEPIYTATTGHVEFQNTSTYDGDASFLWDYGNGMTSMGMGGNVWYTENGIYVVCLTITTNNCTDTYCETIVIDGFEEECNGTEINVVISTDYNDNGEDSWTITLSLNGEFVATFPFVSCAICPDVIEIPLCVPDGCYEIEFNSDFGISATEILVAAYLIGNELPLGEVSIGFNEENGSFQVGVNDDCVDSVGEANGASWSVYPNPAGQTLNISADHLVPGTMVTMMDATGRIVLSQQVQSTIHQLNVAALAPGMYNVRLTNDVQSVVMPVIVSH